MTKAKKPSKKAAKPKTTTAKPKRKSPSKTQPAPKPVPPEIRALKQINYKLMLERINDGQHFTAIELGHALKVNAYHKNPMPDKVLEYYFQFLTGGLQKGHVGKAKNREAKTWEAYAVFRYNQKLEELLAEREAQGFKRRRSVEQKNQFDELSKEAARWVLSSTLKGKKSMEVASFLNLVSRYKKGEK